MKGTEGKISQTGRDVLGSIVHSRQMIECLDEVRLLLPTCASTLRLVLHDNADAPQGKADCVMNAAAAPLWQALDCAWHCQAHVVSHIVMLVPSARVGNSANCIGVLLPVRPFFGTYSRQ